MPTRISKDNFEKEVLQADKTVLADFYSDSCVPCKRLSPVLFALEEEYAEKLKIVKININFDSELAEKYEVQAAPTLVFFKNGEEVSRLRGAVKQAEIKEVIEKSKDEFNMPKALFDHYKNLRLETKLAYVSILETMKNKAVYTTENLAYVKVDNPQIQANLTELANKEVDQEKVNKYLKELEEVELIKVDKQNIFVYDVLS